MKQFLVSLVMLVVTTLGAHAQFEKDVWYVNASLTGLDLSHSCLLYTSPSPRD